MSIPYSDLFTKLGVLVKPINLWLAYQSTLLVYADAVLDQYEDRRDLVTNVQTSFQGFTSVVAGWEQQLKASVDAVLSDLQLSLSAPASDVATILPLLYANMVANSQTILKSVATTTVTSTGSTVGNGTLLSSVLNDLGINEQRAINETVLVRNVQNQYNGGAFGSERFSLTGYQNAGAFSYKSRGNGNGPQITTSMAGNSKLSNGGFETFSSSIPTNWSRVAGTAATNITSDATNVVASFSANALKLISDGSTATITLTQSVTLKPSTLYCFTIMCRRLATLGAGSTLTIKYTDASGANNNVAFDPNGLTTSYALKSLFFNTSATPGSGLITITWTSVGGITTGQAVLLDDFALVQPDRFGNVGYVLARGSVGWDAADFYSVATANNFAGVFQTFFGRFYNFQLPSATSGAETISDALAT